MLAGIAAYVPVMAEVPLTIVIIVSASVITDVPLVAEIVS